MSDKSPGPTFRRTVLLTLEFSLSTPLCQYSLLEAHITAQWRHQSRGRWNLDCAGRLGKWLMTSRSCVGRVLTAVTIWRKHSTSQALGRQFIHHHFVRKITRKASVELLVQYECCSMISLKINTWQANVHREVESLSSRFQNKVSAPKHKSLWLAIWCLVGTR